MTNNQTRNELDELLGTPFGMEETAQQTQLAQTEGQPVALLDRLSAEEQEKARGLAKQIPTGNREAILTYGANAQNQLSQFSHKMLDHVQRKDIGPVGDVLHDLMKKLEQLNPEELTQKKQKGLRKVFNRAKYSVQEMMSKYQKLSTQVDRISVQLDHSKRGLLEDVQMLEQLYDQNKTYFQALNVYIAAAEIKRDEIMNETIPALRKKAEASNDQMAYQEVNDMVQYVDRLEKRLYDLQLSRQITIQSAPQIRMIQQTNQTLAEKIQSSIMTSIPLWKNQIAIALTLNKQMKAVEAQKQVTATTNDLLLKNSEMLKMNSIETARENERGIVEIETLKQTQENLLETIEETLKIQAEGRRNRKAAELEIGRMEEDLKQRLLAIHDGQEKN
ncbi:MULTISPECIES: toxic anion resistance protein [unclassified Planococcus (in: firmicutes)]|uniref:toxic anion resistance protein n=1 Tax=unclassified Planococcus (in: firmicutes) TaxID=2662419 RepID=UPI000C7C8F19|nr:MULTISPECIES: toxic anion resistance protein [unclassified Planococcus (in: firmicutes)]PKG47919.1 toxic anion resistance protein [Planococcus sp. Urea-trap-24]PKG91767.1 toxic anion resistance protein [Planococcus sp. Urea-3u-39]PKH43329.1 toxic anion resistance protein [Planococcus sp. MB-3u-09]